MREIKFRGKRLDNGEWVYGDLHIRTPFPHIHSEIDYSRVNIDPHTVGQFTGLHDKNGKEIYEGDIVAIAGVIKGIVRYNARYWRYEIATADEPLENERIPSGRPEECWMVVGNIHDNPELLKTE
ncbi:MAG: YopX family protein [Paludibacteraceae bacterium]|nr:YopX family protein [Paludibacteraceae bacterium]